MRHLHVTVEREAGGEVLGREGGFVILTFFER